MADEKRGYRLNVGADIESEGPVSEDLIAEDIQLILNDWVGVETPSGVDVELERID